MHAMDDLPALLSLEQAYLHATRIIGLAKGEFLIEVRNHLASGKLQSSGCSRSTGGRRVDIPPDAWHEYQPFFDRDGVASLVILSTGDRRPDLPVFGWGNLRFHREEVLKLWPVTGAQKKMTRKALDEYLKTLGPCNADIAWKQAEAHFGAPIDRESVRKSPTRIKGKAGRRPA
jgi:hypothetical protein